MLFWAILNHSMILANYFYATRAMLFLVPFHHKTDSRSSLVFEPLDMMSAVRSFVSWWISDVRIATNVFHLQDGELIHANATIESIRKDHWSLLVLLAVATLCESCANNTAPKDSSRGMDIACKRATRDFAYKNCTFRVFVNWTNVNASTVRHLHRVAKSVKFKFETSLSVFGFLYPWILISPLLILSLSN